MKLCQINYDASHYRETIYRAIDKEFDCDSYFGLPPYDGVKQMDTSGFNGVVKYTKIVTLPGCFFQKGIIPLIWKPYDVYLGLGETHGISSWLFPLIVRLFKPKKKVFFWSHGWYGKESKKQMFIKRLFFRLPNGGTFVYGDHARKLMIEAGLPEDKIFVIHNSLAYPKQLQIRLSITPSSIYAEHFNNMDPVIVMVGRLNARKHLDMLFNALQILQFKGLSCNTVLIGDGTDRRRLEEIVSKLGINDRVWFYGACYDEKQNAELIYNADLCVVPGDIGLTAIHAMMFGTPVISHNNFPYQGPEFEAIKPGITGDFFEYGSVESLADTMQNWFATQTNREVVRQNCYREIDTQWTPDYQINILKEHLK